MTEPSFFSLPEACRRLYAQGLVHGCAGNVSERSGSDMRITASGASFESLQESDVTVVSLTAPEQGQVATPRPSSEWRVHRAIYLANPRISAIVHAHPTYATAFSVAGESMETPFLSEMIALLGPIPLLPFEPPGSQALADALGHCLQDHHGALLANHGVFSVGTSLQEAFMRMTLIEAQAKTLIYARQLGAPRPLTPDQLAQMAPC
ncbi:MAG: class II aldolase/adducin family protein [Vampirovibrionales bacterium]|nr:class II aldolase/adducin family protein [Vampirovibrionales bacterium]